MLFYSPPPRPDRGVLFRRVDQQAQEAPGQGSPAGVLETTGRVHAPQQARDDGVARRRRLLQPLLLLLLLSIYSRVDSSKSRARWEGGEGGGVRPGPASGKRG